MSSTQRRIERQKQAKRVSMASDAMAALEPHKEKLETRKADIARTEACMRLLISARSVMCGGTKLDGESIEESCIPYQEDRVRAEELLDLKVEVKSRLVDAKANYTNAILDYLDAVEELMEAEVNPPLIHPVHAGPVTLTGDPQ